MVDNVEIGTLTIPAIKGDKGEQGVPGKDAKIVKILVNMLEPNQDPTAENEGTDSEVIIRLGIPRADDIQDISINESGTLVFVLRSGRPVEAGKVKYVKSARIENGELIFTFLDETEISAGILYDDEFCKQKIDEYNSNVDNKIQELNDTANQVQTSLSNFKKNIDEENQNFNENAKEKLDNYNSMVTNAEEELKAFEKNIDTKTKDYNDLVESSENKLNELSENIDNKTNTFNENFESKLNEYNENANLKMEEIKKYNELFIELDSQEIENIINNLEV